MVASGHAVALVPGVLVSALRRDVVPVRTTEAPTRGIYATLPAHPEPREEIEDLVATLTTCWAPSPR